VKRSHPLPDIPELISSLAFGEPTQIPIFPLLNTELLSLTTNVGSEASPNWNSGVPPLAKVLAALVSNLIFLCPEAVLKPKSTNCGLDDQTCSNTAPLDPFIFCKVSRTVPKAFH